MIREFITIATVPDDYDVKNNRHEELIRCKDCQEWNRKDGMFKDIDGRQWHHCECLGIDTDAWFYCREAERKEE